MLPAMVDRIGVSRRWIQKQGTVHEHFDICVSKRKLAVPAGAIEITQRGLVGRIYGLGTPEKEGGSRQARLLFWLLLGRFGSSRRLLFLRFPLGPKPPCNVA